MNDLLITWIAGEPALKRSRPSASVSWSSSIGMSEYSTMIVFPSRRQKCPSFSIGSLLMSALADMSEPERWCIPMNSGSKRVTIGLSTCQYER